MLRAAASRGIHLFSSRCACWRPPQSNSLPSMPPAYSSDVSTKLNEEDLRSAIRLAFSKDTTIAARVLASELQMAEQAGVLNAIRAETTSKQMSPKYIHDLFQEVDTDDSGTLCRSELEAALKVHLTLSHDTRMDAPTQQESSRIFLSSAIPFVGFGFLDNFIMIMAGDTIDLTFGVMFSLSTMAAAGFGNMISDIAGIYCADWIEARVKFIKWARSPPLSSYQMKLPAVRRIKSLGAVIGISVGCLLGMFPLLFMHKKHDIDTDDATPELCQT